MRHNTSIRLDEGAIPAGRLRYDQQGARESAAFEYDLIWIADGERFALSPGPRLVGGLQFHRKVRDDHAGR